MTAPKEGPLDHAAIALLPACHGAYRLWDRDRVLFVGMTTGTRTLRSELMRHWRGDFGPTQRASHFECLAASTPDEAHEHYLALYLSSGLRAEPPAARAERPALGGGQPGMA